MIDFDLAWLPQIVGYANIISTGQLEDQWLGRSSPATSVTDPDELFEQVFDDLDAQDIWSEARNSRTLSKSAVEAIDRFFAALRDVDGRDGAKFVSTDAWSKVREAAGAVLANVG